MLSNGNTVIQRGQNNVLPTDKSELEGREAAVVGDDQIDQLVPKNSQGGESNCRLTALKTALVYGPYGGPELVSEGRASHRPNGPDLAGLIFRSARPAT